MRILLVLLLLCASAEKTLAAKDPCDRFSDADAYNNCLAGFGPAAGPKAYSKAPAASQPPSASKEPAHERARPNPHRRALAKSRSDEPDAKPILAKPVGKGRVRLELMVPTER